MRVSWEMGGKAGENGVGLVTWCLHIGCRSFTGQGLFFGSPIGCRTSGRFEGECLGLGGLDEAGD